MTLPPHRIIQLEAMEPQVRYWLKGRMGGHPDHEEVLQKVLIRASTSPSGFDGKRWTFGKWIWAIVNNTLIDHWRDMNRKHILRTESFQPYDPPQYTRSAIRSEIEEDTAGEIMAVIDTLLPSYSRVLKRHIAGEPLGVSDNMLSQARRALKDKLRLRGLCFA